MDGVKALAVLASIYYPGDGIVAKNNYQTSSGELYDRSAPKCAALLWPLGTMLHLVHGRNNIDVTINDHGPYRRGRALDCTPAVDKALHLGGLGSVRVEPYPPLPKARPAEVEPATGSGTERVEPYPPLPKARPVELEVATGSGTERVEPYPPLPKTRPVEVEVATGSGTERVEPYPPLPKTRPVEVEVATGSGTDPIDAPVKPAAEHDPDKSLRSLPSNDGPQRLKQPNRLAAARHHAPISSVAPGNNPPGDASGLFILSTW
jgi:hypothetical protein